MVTWNCLHKMKIFFSKKKGILLCHIAAVTSQIPCWNCLIRYNAVFIDKRALNKARPGVETGISRNLSENHALDQQGNNKGLNLSVELVL